MDSKTGSRKPGSDHTLELAFARTPEAAGRNLLFFSNGLLLAYAQDECNLKSERAQCVAELFLREFLKKGSAGKEIDSILPDGELSAFHLCWGDSREKKDSPFLLPSWQEKNDFSRLCKVEVRKRLTELREKTDGFIPVYLKDDAFFIPFRLVENARSGDVIVDLAGRPFESWTEPCARVFRLAEKDLGKTPGYQCVVSCDQSGLPGFLGNSLMLPLYLACLRKAGKIHYNPLRVLATGAIDDNGMITAVETMEKLTGFRAHFDDACFFFPESANSDSSKRHEIALPRMDLARITGILESYVNAFGLSALPGRDASPGFCSIRLPVSKNFVGRSEELINLDERICRSGRIPVLTGDAGAGKTELAVAFAYRYAHRFPQGRFLVPMEGVATWTDAMGKLVEMCEVNCRTSPEELGLPENFSKLRPEEKRTAVYRMLANRAKKGALLLLLDNLDNTDLLSETGLRELAGPTGLPDRLHMIATTRRNESLRADFADPVVLVEVGNLKEKDALELFCQIGKNVYQFANCPMGADGRLRFDKLPEDSRPTEDRIREIEQEYAALQEIVRQLECHAWSLEIVASYFAFFISKFGKCDIRKEWSRIRDRLGSLNGKTHRSEKNAGILLQPTFDLILKSDGQGNELGQKIMRLAEFASFFPPEQIPGYALGALWRSEFGDMEIMIEQDGMTVCGNAFNYALTLLKTYRIIHGGDIGDDGAAMFKMHRLTRDVLQNRLSEDVKLGIIGAMRKCLDSFLDNNPEPISQQLLPWCGWAEEWLNGAHSLQMDVDFGESVLTLANCCVKVNMYQNAEEILALRCVVGIKDNIFTSKYLRVKGLFFRDYDRTGEAEDCFEQSLSLRRLAAEDNSDHIALVAEILNNLANLHASVDRCNDADTEYSEALSIYRKLAETNQEEYIQKTADILDNYGVLLKRLKRCREAEANYAEALEIRRKLAEKNPEIYLSDVALSLTHIAGLHKTTDHCSEADAEYSEALSMYRRLAEKNPEIYLSNVARVLHSLGILHKKTDRCDLADAEYSEALSMYRRLAEKNPEIYLSNVASVLHSLGLLHNRQNQCELAETEFAESLEIRRKLAEKNPEIYLSDMANVLDSLGILHKKTDRCDLAETEYSEALSIYRKLAEKNPEIYLSDVAMVLNHIASLHKKTYQDDLAEPEYSEALSIYRKLAEKNPEIYRSSVASVLHNLGLLHNRHDRCDLAETEFAESLEIRRKLAEKNPEIYLSDMANVLDSLGILHKKTDRCDLAETEYSEALSIYRKLAEKNPEIYLSDVAMVLNHIASLHKKTDRCDQAETEYSEALSIYRKLAEKNPGIYLSDVANVLDGLGSLHEDMDHCRVAETEYSEALSIYRKLAEKNPDVYLTDVAEALDSLAGVHDKLGRADDAEKERQEAAEIRKKMSSDKH